MKRWILVMMCAFLYVMPVNATELGTEETSQVAESEEVIEENKAEEGSAQESEPQESEPQESEPQESEPQESEPQESEPQESEPQESEPQESEPEESAGEVDEEVQEPSEETEASSEAVSTPETEEESITEETTEDEVVAEVEIPDVTGMSIEVAEAALGAVVLPDGSGIEVIKNYEYSDDIEADVVMGQNPIGLINAEGAKQVTILISLGVDPDANKPLSDGGAGSMFAGVNWNSVPIAYEYNYDNSDRCWNGGMWLDTEGGQFCYTTPAGEYDNNVRHIIQLYRDEEYVYVHAVMATCYGQAVNGNDYMFYVDGQEVKFKLLSANGNDLSNENWSAGTHSLTVKHENYVPSGTDVIGGVAYCTVFDDGLNTDIQVKIPLSEFKRQNENVNLDSIGSIQFFTNNLMYNRVTSSGAGTFPFATAAAALVLVPGSAYVINRRKSTKKETNEK